MSRRGRLAWALAAAWLATACSPERGVEPTPEIALRIEPSPPTQGEARLSLRLAGPEGPLVGARVEVEANMSHAGMRPSFAALEEVGPGLYEGALHFSMGGDWFLVVTAEAQGGRVVERVIEVPGVASR